MKDHKGGVIDIKNLFLLLILFLLGSATQYFSIVVKADTKMSKATITIKNGDFENQNKDLIKEKNIFRNVSESEEKKVLQLPKTNEKNRSNSIVLGLIIIVFNALGYYKIKEMERNRMKKQIILTTMISLTTFGGIFLKTVAYAEESTKAEVTIKPGALKIKSNDDISFNNLIIDGKDHNNYEEKNVSKINIEDFRGSTSNGWTLGVKIDDGFSKDKTGEANGISLKLNPVVNSNKESATVNKNSITLNGESNTIASVKDDKIKDSEFDTDISLGAKLDIPAKTKAKTYTVTLVWNVTEGPAI